MPVTVKVAKVDDGLGKALYRWAVQQPDVQSQLLEICERQASVCNARLSSTLTFGGGKESKKSWPYNGELFKAGLHKSVRNAKVAGVVYSCGGKKAGKTIKTKGGRTVPNPAIVAARKGALHW